MVSKLKIINSGKSKLALVKAVKSLAKLGLREAKEFIDKCSTDVAVMNIDVSAEDITEFREYVELNCDGLIYELHDQHTLRNRKLIELGLYNEDELVGELVEMDIDNILAESKNISFLRKLLTDRYSKLSNSDIIEMIKTD